MTLMNAIGLDIVMLSGLLPFGGREVNLFYFFGNDNTQSCSSKKVKPRKRWRHPSAPSVRYIAHQLQSPTEAAEAFRKWRGIDQKGHFCI